MYKNLDFKVVIVFPYAFILVKVIFKLTPFKPPNPPSSGHVVSVPITVSGDSIHPDTRRLFIGLTMLKKGKTISNIYK